VQVTGLFDGAHAWRLRQQLAKRGGDSPLLILDFARVSEFHDFAVAVLAQGLSQQAPGTVVLCGLRRHHRRLFASFGLQVLKASEAPAWAG